MSTPESGMCSLENYTHGKQFVVKPDRLCIDGVYTFACKARPGLDWRACLFTVKLEEIQPMGSLDLRRVALAFEELGRPRRYHDRESYPITGEGLIKPRIAGSPVFEEAYLRHRFDDIDEKLNNIEQFENIEPRVETLPFAVSTDA